MAKLLNIEKLTDNRFLNLFEGQFHNAKTNKDFKYFIASRRHSDELACKTRNHKKCDAVMVVPMLENSDLIVIKQYRPAINDYIYEFPAGLVDNGETIEAAAKREVHEEIGANVLDMREIFPPMYTSVGMSDETVAVYLAKIDDNLTTDNKEENEDIEIHSVKLDDIPTFLKEEVVSIKTAMVMRNIYHLATIAVLQK